MDKNKVETNERTKETLRMLGNIQISDKYIISNLYLDRDMNIWRGGDVQLKTRCACGQTGRQTDWLSERETKEMEENLCNKKRRGNDSYLWHSLDLFLRPPFVKWSEATVTPTRRHSAGHSRPMQKSCSTQSPVRSTIQGQEPQQMAEARHRGFTSEAICNHNPSSCWQIKTNVQIIIIIKDKHVKTKCTSMRSGVFPRVVGARCANSSLNHPACRLRCFICFRKVRNDTTLLTAVSFPKLPPPPQFSSHWKRPQHASISEHTKR